jgi:hypothetical protein
MCELKLHPASDRSGAKKRRPREDGVLSDKPDQKSGLGAFFFLGFVLGLVFAATASTIARLDGGEGDEGEASEGEEDFIHTPTGYFGEKERQGG